MRAVVRKGVERGFVISALVLAYPTLVWAHVAFNYVLYPWVTGHPRP